MIHATGLPSLLAEMPEEKLGSWLCLIFISIYLCLTISKTKQISK